MALGMQLTDRFLHNVAASVSRKIPVAFAGPRLAVPLLAWASLGAGAAHAQDATWLLNPATNDWNVAGNWTPATIPSDTASFGASNTVSLTFSASPTSINTIQFNPGAPGYTFNLSSTLNINGTGIANNSSNTPNFIFNGTLDFFNSSTAGNAAITNNGALNFFNAGTAGNAIIASNSALVFHDNSTAGNANIAGNASLTFRDSSSAGAAAIVNNSSLDFFNSSTAGASNITSNSALVFHDGSTAGNAKITGNASLTFLNSSSAGAAAITNNSSLSFFNSSTAGASNITSNSTLVFHDGSTAGNATITNNNSASFFRDSSTAGWAVIIANNGGSANFVSMATGGNARFITNVGGIFDISGLSSVGMTSGSIEGAGRYFLGSKALTVGGNNLSATVSGLISDGGIGGGVGGSLTKVGTGTLLLTGASTYTGPTDVDAGTLGVNGSLVSAVTVNNGGTLMGNGMIGGLTVASGGGVAPGNSIGTLNVNGNVTFAAGSTYQVEINPAGQNDKVLATGKATLSGGTVRVIAAPGIYSASIPYTILTANGGVTGTFAQLSTSSNFNTGSIFLTPSLSYDADDVFLGLSQAPFT